MGSLYTRSAHCYQDGYCFWIFSVDRVGKSVSKDKIPHEFIALMLLIKIRDQGVFFLMTINVKGKSVAKFK